MNWKHIKSTCCDTFLIGEHDGIRLASNGHIQFVFNDEFVKEPKAAYTPSDITKPWIAAKREPAPAPIGGVHKVGEKHYRLIGSRYISEHYYRCFVGDGVTFTCAAKGNPLVVHKDGAMVGLIMPVRHDGGGDVGEYSDEEVFGIHACAENGWYLCSRSMFKREIEEQTSELRRCRERRDELNDEIENYEAEIDSLRERMESL